MTASKLSVVDAVAKVDPERNASLQPNFLGAGNTWCNRFVQLVCRELDVTLGGVFANEQAEWLNTQDAIANGWAPSTEVGARQWAQGGGLALVHWRNPAGGHGHIAVLVPALPKSLKGLTYVAQAGSRNFSHGPLYRGFGGLAPQFHTYSPARVAPSKEQPHA